MLWFFDTSPFLPRDCCGQFLPATRWLWVAASVGLFVAYLSTAVLVDRFRAFALTRHPGFPRWSLPWVCLFFVGCGGGHLEDALAFWWPAYRFFMLWDWFTLVVSVGGFFGLRAAYRWVREVERERDEARRQRDDAEDTLRAERDRWRDKAMELAALVDSAEHVALTHTAPQTPPFTPAPDTGVLRTELIDRLRKIRSVAAEPIGDPQ